jgi:hypothetical protein
VLGLGRWLFTGFVDHPRPVLNPDGRKALGSDPQGALSRHSALSYEHAGKIEAQLKAEVAELLAKAEAADKADISEGMSIPEELARREERLGKIAEARAKLNARTAERYALVTAACAL